jgi:tetrahydromethanopterin S-methyltransferase subunit F
MTTSGFSRTKTPLQVVDENYRSTMHGGGSDGGGDMESRVAKLESDAEHIKNTLTDIKYDIRDIKKDARVDFRLIFAAIISVALGLAGLMAKGFHWL